MMEDLSGDSFYKSFMNDHKIEAMRDVGWFYHGTDESGFNEILNAKSINPIYKDRYQTPTLTNKGIVYLANGYSEPENSEKKLNPFYLATEYEMACGYGNIVLKLHSSKITNLYQDKVNRCFFTFDIIPINIKKITQETIPIYGKKYIFKTIL